jgi:hypothetical protein
VGGVHFGRQQQGLQNDKSKFYKSVLHNNNSKVLSPFFKVFLSSRASIKLVAMELLHVFGTVPLVAKVCQKCVGGDYSVGVPVVPSPILIKQHKTWCSLLQNATSAISGGTFVEHVHSSSQYWIQRGN